ncbi:uncharacterized protein EpC_12400 [Erwinia pyrifoliae Ep1/96]|nr:uncharacterized protein EpC_12400 [Erwinia pyrifoliae Ep1/96]
MRYPWSASQRRHAARQRHLRAGLQLVIRTRQIHAFHGKRPSLFIQNNLYRHHIRAEKVGI